MTQDKKRTAVWNKCPDHCWYCGKVISKEEMCIDHVMPRLSGGTNNIDNLLPSCRSCNSAKRHKHIESYRQWLEWKSVGVEPFTDKQIDYLTLHRVDLPRPPRLDFYGERMDENGTSQQGCNHE